MQFYSSVSQVESYSLSEAILNSLPSDGGLLVPAHFPALPQYHDKVSYIEYATQLLQSFAQDDQLFNSIGSMCRQAFTFTPNLVALGEHHLLELFHGPSLSFKDFGAQFLSNAITQIPSLKPRLVLVATSGDTGSAVAAAFHGKPNVKVVVLYPAEGVSERQAHQLSCWGGNVTTFAVKGTFDDCQAMVKTALNDQAIADFYNVTTANSINVGRLLPQVVYYSFISAQYSSRYQRDMNLIVPSGNLGNVTAACWAKAMGAAISNIVIAQNANQFVVDYIQTGQAHPKATIATIANAMDVGSPSNFERLRYLHPQFEDFCDSISAYSVSEEKTCQTIQYTYEKTGEVICPHTAVGVSLLPELTTDSCAHWVVAATAHAAKFETIVEPLIGRHVLIPKRLQAQLDLARYDKPLSAHYGLLKEKLLLRVNLK